MMTRSLTPKLPQVHLSPGKLIVTRESKIVVTVLGSCVAVTMFDRLSGLAAICHAMLAEPHAAAERMHGGDPMRFRYMTEALPAMLDAYRRAAILPQTIEVKIFGGGNVIGESHAKDPQWIGGANLTIARRLLEDAGLTVVAENTGGRRGSKILFNTATGTVLHKHLHNPRP